MKVMKKAELAIGDGYGGYIKTQVCNTSHSMQLKELLHTCPDCGAQIFHTVDHPTHPKGKCSKPGNFRIYGDCKTSGPVKSNDVFIRLVHDDVEGGVYVVAVDPYTGREVDSGFIAKFADGELKTYNGVNGDLSFTRRDGGTSIKVVEY